MHYFVQVLEGMEGIIINDRVPNFGISNGRLSVLTNPNFKEAKSSN
jgi:hypothetical protein